MARASCVSFTKRRQMEKSRLTQSALAPDSLEGNISLEQQLFSLQREVVLPLMRCVSQNIVGSGGRLSAKLMNLHFSTGDYYCWACTVLNWVLCGSVTEIESDRRDGPDG